MKTEKPLKNNKELRFVKKNDYFCNSKLHYNIVI